MSAVPTSAAAPAAADPFPGYRPGTGRYDECRAPDGTLRPHWAEFFRLLGSNPHATLRHAQAACLRAIVEQDVSMNVYAGERSDAQPWPLDAVPLLLAADDWSALTSGIRQRARLLNEILRDLYGPQNLLRNAALPAALAMRNPHYLRSCVGLGRPDDIMLHTYAVDIARSPDGQWWVLRDRLDAPSGLGYSLQNRILTRQVLPQVFQSAPVERLYEFFRGFRNSLERLSPPRHGEESRVVFLTPGPANEAYFEQAYLARYLGYPLVEGADLTTRDRQVFLRTVGGLRRVDTILRRVDSSFCDPLELHGHSLLGVPGLVHAAHGNRVALANQLGVGALETTALLAFLGPLCREVLGEPLQLPSVATWWCGHEEARETVLKNLDTLVVKPAFREPGLSTARFGTLLSEAERATLAAEIRAKPWAFCGQERIHLGTTPAWIDNALRPAPFILRLFVAWEDGDYRVMPGGLTRFHPTGDDAIVTLQHGGITKDTWVLHPGNPTPPPPVNALADIVHRPNDTPSRLADNLFWLGRYLERTTRLARLLEKLDPLLRDEIAALDPSVAHSAVRLLLDTEGARIPPAASLEQLDALLADAVKDPALPASLVSNVGSLVRNLDQAKVRLPPEAWRSLRLLRAALDADKPPLPADLAPHLSALETIANETLAHDTSWRFLMLGRHLERSQKLIFLARHLLGAAAPTEFRLQTLLHFADSLFSYRTTFHGAFQPASVLAWLFAAPENPRGLRFLADHINEHLLALPEDLSPRAVAALRATAFRLVSRVRLLDAASLAGAPAQTAAFLQEAFSTLAEISDRVTQVYFIHTEPPK
ncbi:circularly permuted type 2 ATP-grasp protein [Horticoccus sp. 23ND18S-11]|uniref:circularly permuted type 2 ATP-grasp protein n=1 Tax=Horticoccus sp. 23ND18S-11 TaxID=3391832 RepID=UPI0039C9556D